MAEPDFWKRLVADMPWLEQIGLDPAWLQEMLAETSGAAEQLVRIRDTPQYKARFPGLYRSDGSVRMDEAQYLQREQEFRTLLRQYGYEMEDYQSPQAMVGFFDAEFSPDEFQQRLATYDQVKKSSQAKKDAFYVYAGLDVTDDDLYEATVDPAASQRLSERYNEAVAASPLDYGMWITRATEVGLQRVADQLTTMQRNGLVTGAAVQSVLRTDPDFARKMMDAIYTGGTGSTTSTLSLEDLLSSFDYAVIGGAATEAGLTLPTKERLAEIRVAGVERRQAIEAYQAYGQSQGALSGASQRSGGGGLTQDEFERGRFLGDQAATRELQVALSSEEAAGRDQGEFRFAEDQGRLVQRGFGVRR